jgi:hypothetical protein
VILLLAIIAGLMAGLARARCGNGHLKPPEFRLIWLAPIAFLPQWFAFHVSVTSRLITDNLASAALVSSQALLLVFAWLNRKLPGFWALGIGLVLNLLVIVLNGGLMPVSPKVVEQLLPDALPDAWPIGKRIGWNIVLPRATTRLWWLSDHLLLPAWFPVRKALSPGDFLIAGGAFWLLWASGDPKQISEQKGGVD